MPDMVSSPDLPEEPNTASNHSSLNGPIMRIAILVLIVGISIMLVVRKNKTFIPSQTAPAQSTSSEPTQVPTDLTQDWQTYTNTKYGFSFEYSKPLNVTDETTEFVTLYGGMLPTSSLDLFVVVEVNSSNYPGLKTEQELTANSIKWDIGYFQACSPQECQKADKIYRTSRNGIIYSVIFVGYDDRGGVSPDPDYKVFEDRTLSTFKFLDPNVSEDQISNCQTNSDCIVVPYSHCCGQSKRAINKKYKLLYESHAEWQKFDNPEVCSRIGICPRDSHVTETVCNQDKHCELVY